MILMSQRISQEKTKEKNPRHPLFNVLGLAKQGRGKKTKVANDKQDQTPAERRAAMTWAHQK
jgi:hypothetical protein